MNNRTTEQQISIRSNPNQKFDRQSLCPTFRTFSVCELANFLNRVTPWLYLLLLSSRELPSWLLQLSSVQLPS